MADLLKTWPAFMDRKKVLKVFTNEWGCEFYFTLGDAPNQSRKYPASTGHTRAGSSATSILPRVVQNDGSLPKLRSITGEVSEWQIKPDHFVAVCAGSLHRLETKIFHTGFRGWRYFDLGSYMGIA